MEILLFSSSSTHKEIVKKTLTISSSKQFVVQNPQPLKELIKSANHAPKKIFSQRLSENTAAAQPHSDVAETPQGCPQPGDPTGTSRPHHLWKE